MQNSIIKRENKRSNEIVIELNDVSIILDNRPILQHINLKVHRGEYIGLIGRNGSGKTTLMKTILGLIPIYSGTIKIFGKPISRESLNKIGYVPQISSIRRQFPATVEDIIGMGLYKKRLFKPLTKEDKSKIMYALHLVKMESFLNRPIGHLSGGEQQKVFLAQALVQNPEILLLDEPMSALDFVIVQDFLSLLERLNKEKNITMIVIQHNLGMLKPFCDRLLMLRGTIFYDGPPNDPRVDEIINKVFI
ncbi:MAG: metal ABC transporter ATP-binding protein [Promethearchaeota archaeon]